MCLQWWQHCVCIVRGRLPAIPGWLCGSKARTLGVCDQGISAYSITKTTLLGLVKSLAVTCASPRRQNVLVDRLGHAILLDGPNDVPGQRLQTIRAISAQR